MLCKKTFVDILLSAKSTVSCSKFMKKILRFLQVSKEERPKFSFATESGVKI